mmetsp:Transcript_151670/g.290338  ORF Transcript_151670/g.290338 Transcript_151670/m.290338 type:complete len:227 (+) Transcript_151670:1485-2165(+)
MRSCSTASSPLTCGAIMRSRSTVSSACDMTIDAAPPLVTAAKPDPTGPRCEGIGAVTSANSSALRMSSGAKPPTCDCKPGDNTGDSPGGKRARLPASASRSSAWPCGSASSERSFAWRLCTICTAKVGNSRPRSSRSSRRSRAATVGRAAKTSIAQGRQPPSTPSNPTASPASNQAVGAPPASRKPVSFPSSTSSAPVGGEPRAQMELRACHCVTRSRQASAKSAR